ncbi:hypothetical protein ANTRET_LOCUS5738 [Anthophora retusa]
MHIPRTAAQSSLVREQSTKIIMLATIGPSGASSTGRRGREEVRCVLRPEEKASELIRMRIDPSSETRKDHPVQHNGTRSCAKPTSGLSTPGEETRLVPARLVSPKQ